MLEYEEGFYLCNLDNISLIVEYRRSEDYWQIYNSRIVVDINEIKVIKKVDIPMYGINYK